MSLSLPMFLLLLLWRLEQQNVLFARTTGCGIETLIEIISTDFALQFVEFAS